ncbi:unnamed protein product [Lactuca saligna]|uniref:Uncharacterized protein n=1 Tax=Lactuca saligna TaxID=75948 RepID=A0AA35YB05_LACSI|nr:unnamed protein product [Lactuca saligna]CAI9280279.1 unnamed protein product [Lactuca saligna]
MVEDSKSVISTGTLQDMKRNDKDLALKVKELAVKRGIRENGKERDGLKDQLDDFHNMTRIFMVVSVLEASLKMVEDFEKNRMKSAYKTKLEQDLKNFKREEHKD